MVPGRQRTAIGDPRPAPDDGLRLGWRLAGEPPSHEEGRRGEAPPGGPPPTELTGAPSARFRVIVRRDLGAVVVAVRGDLDGPGAGHLGHVLADLIDGQGNLAVVVDLRDAGAADASAAAVLAAAAERAGRRGGALHLRDSAGLLDEALQPRGLGALVGDIGDNDSRHVGPRSPRPRSWADHPAGGARNLTPQHKGA